MARISFEEFSSGLPVTRNNNEITTPSDGYSKTETRQDFVQTGEQLMDIGERRSQQYQGIQERINAGETSKAMGAFQKFGTGLGAALETGYTATKGLVKSILPPDKEKSVSDFLNYMKEGVSKNAEMQKQKIENLKTSDNPNEREVARQIEEISTLYQNDQDFRDTVQASGAILEALSFYSGKPVKEGFDLTLGKTKDLIPDTQPTVSNFLKPSRTPEQAALAVVEAANPDNAVSASVIPTGSSAIVDTATGVTQQLKDFGSRTVREARDTAEWNRTLNTLPEPEAAVLRAGADSRTINVIKNAPDGEVSVYKELIEQAKRKESDPTPNTAQPKEIAGREMLVPVKYILDERSKVGSSLGEIRKNLDSKQNINTNPAFRNFHQYLKNDLQIQFDKNGNIIPGSGKLAPSDVNEVQKMYSELRSKTFASQRDIDEWLQRSFKEYDLRKAREQTFSDDVTNIAERARAELGNLMPDEYNSLRKQYAEMSKPIEDVVKLLGYKGDIDKLTTKDLKAGEVSLRILGNAADRPQSVIDDVINTATKYGYESDIDLNRLIYVTDQLEDLYDITPTRGFSGSTARGVDQSSVGVIGDAVTMNLGGLWNKALSSRASRQEARDAFEAYINSL